LGELSEMKLLVVGGSSGVGRAVGLAAAREGAKVAFAGRRLDRLEEAAAEAGGGAVGLACDVRDPGSCQAVVDEAARRLGGLTCLLYTPTYLQLRFLEDAGPEDWAASLETNIVGPALITRAALAHLRSARGRVVYVSSDWSRYPRQALCLYGVGKAGLDTLCLGFRIEVPEVAFSTVVLGPTAPTEVWRDWDWELADRMLKHWEAKGINYRGVMQTEDAAAEILGVLRARVRIDEVVLEPPEGGPQ
jgi:NAD(P)-dependent dehydrogenase (short-subunit alcohol dehydrogenase family)